MDDFFLYDINHIHCDNCMNLIDSLPELSVDAIITDFPYGINYQSNHRAKKFAKIDNDLEPYIEWIKPAFSKMKEGGRLVCFYRYDVQEELLEELKNAGFAIKSQLVWDKDNWSAGDLESSFGIQHELMIYATKGRYSFVNGRPSTVYRSPRVGGGQLIHPNEKPVSLNRALIRDITSIGELILEPFSGSGSLPVAAKMEKRNFIACDTSQEYCDLGNNRVLNANSSGLF